MDSFEINGREYKAQPMNVMKQWAVARRIAPLIAKTMEPKVLKQATTLFQNMPKPAEAPTAADGVKADDQQTPANVDGFIDLLATVAQPFMDAIAAMSDEDSDFVIGTCLATVQMNQANKGWSGIWIQGAGLRFQEIDMMEMLQIVVRVIMGNLSTFSLASILNLVGPSSEKVSAS